MLGAHYAIDLLATAAMIGRSELPSVSQGWPDLSCLRDLNRHASATAQSFRDAPVAGRDGDRHTGSGAFFWRRAVLQRTDRRLPTRRPRWEHRRLARVHRWRKSVSSGLRQAGRRVRPSQPSEGRPFFPHPPLAVFLIAPLAVVPVPAAAAVWFALSIGLLFVLAVLLSEAVLSAPADRPSVGLPPGAIVFPIFLTLLVWPPVLYNLEKGQWSILLSLLVALVWRLLARGRPNEAGLTAGLAAGVKVFPALLAVYLLLRGRRPFVWFVVTSSTLFLLPLALIGPAAFPGFLANSQANLAYWGDVAWRHAFAVWRHCPRADWRPLGAAHRAHAGACALAGRYCRPCAGRHGRVDHRPRPGG